MPFTISHAAAALPFRRTKLILSAVVAGTFGPDIEYFLRLHPGGGYGHTLSGAFLQSLPLALLGLWAYHTLVKHSVARLSPLGIELRLESHLAPFQFGGLPRFGFILLSALVGIATHILLDSFTHENTWLQRRFIEWAGMDSHAVFAPSAHAQAYFAMMQTGTSIVGLLILLGWTMRLYRSTPPKAAQNRSLLPGWQKQLLSGMVLSFAIICSVRRIFLSCGKWRFLADADWGSGVVVFVAAIWWQLLILGIAFRMSAKNAVVDACRFWTPGKTWL